MPPNAPQSYRGYGLPDPQPVDSAHPIGSVAAAIKAAVNVLERSLLTVEPASWQAPPFRSRYLTDSRRTVLNIAASVSAPVNAAGIAIAAAESLFAPLDPTILTTTGSGLLQLFTLWEIIPPDSHVVVIDSWGITCVNAPPEALAVRVQGGTVGGAPTAPDPAVSSFRAKDHQKTKVIVKPNTGLKVQIGNVTNLTALFVEFSVSYYMFPISKYTDDKRDMRLIPGFGGKDC